MASAPAPSGVGGAMYAPARANVHALRPSEAAWLVVVPCALVTVAAIVLLGPLVGRTFLAPGGEAFWPMAGARPEPLQHGRFVVGLLGPALLVGVVLASARRRLALPSTLTRLGVRVSQVVAIGFLAVCVAAQNDVGFNADFILQPHTAYFTWPTLLVAAVLAPLALLLLARARGVAVLIARQLRETPLRRRGCLLAAGGLTAVWLLTAVNLDSSLGNTNEAVVRHLLWTLNEPFAILDGRTPLVDFHAQYAQLWPYVAAAPMAVLGASVGVFTIVMATISGLALLALYATLRRVVRRSPAALLLFVPVLATGFFMVLGPPEDRYGPANLYSLWPIRYAGPYLLAWLTARHIDAPAPRRAWPLFAAGGLAIVNNAEFGAAAFAGSVAALACAGQAPSWRATARLLGDAAIGLLSAGAIVSVLTLASAGELPHLGLLLEFSRLYGIGGWAMLPMPEIGLHLAVFATFAAALVVGVVRAMTRDTEPLLSGMLVWSGVFGLGGSGYFAGRAHPMALFDFFSPWAFSLALLLVVVLHSLSARGWRRPTLPELAVLFGFGLTVCSVAQIPTPWSQIARIDHRTPAPIFKQREATRFVRDATEPGERVEILIPLGFRIAYDLDLVNVSPYSSIESMPTRQQLTTAINALRRAHGHKLFIADQFTFPEELTALSRAGFMSVDGGGGITELSDDPAVAG